MYTQRVNSTRRVSDGLPEVTSYGQRSRQRSDEYPPGKRRLQCLGNHRLLNRSVGDLRGNEIVYPCRLRVCVERHIAVQAHPLL